MRASGSYRWYLCAHTHTVQHKKAFSTSNSVTSNLFLSFLCSFFLSLLLCLSSLSWLSLFNPQITASSQHANKEAQSRDKCLFFVFLFSLFLSLRSLLLRPTNSIFTLALDLYFPPQVHSQYIKTLSRQLAPRTAHLQKH